MKRYVNKSSQRWYVPTPPEKAASEDRLPQLGGQEDAFVVHDIYGENKNEHTRGVCTSRIWMLVPLNHIQLIEDLESGGSIMTEKEKELFALYSSFLRDAADEKCCLTEEAFLTLSNFISLQLERHRHIAEVHPNASQGVYYGHHCPKEED